MLLHCVRHGESAFNAEGRIQGQLNVPLSPLGVWQSQAVAAALGRLPIDAVYASPLARAMETARPVAEALGLPLTLDERLMELNAGVFQGKLWSEIQSEHPEAALCWLSHDPDFVIPGGESRRQLMVRGLAALDSIRQQGYQQVAIVAHGGVLSAAFKALLGVPAERNPFELYNGSISQIRWDAKIKLMTLNQIDHLLQRDGEIATRAGDL